MTKEHWQKKHTDYKKRDWINKPSIFATEAIEYFPKDGKILELGAGFAQDGRFFAQKGYEVICTDNGDVAIKEAKALVDQSSLSVSVEEMDLERPFPYTDQEFDVVYAHLSLHYFSDSKTKEIFSEIHRVLKEGGVLAFFTNSIDDPEYDTGIKLEDHYFEIEGIKKRYLSTETARSYAADFEPIICDNRGETYKDNDMGVHNLIRFIGRK